MFELWAHILNVQAKFAGGKARTLRFLSSKSLFEYGDRLGDGIVRHDNDAIIVRNDGVSACTRHRRKSREY